MAAGLYTFMKKSRKHRVYEGSQTIKDGKKEEEKEEDMAAGVYGN